MKPLPYNPTHVNTNGLGSTLFARRYLGNRKDLLPDLNGSWHHFKFNCVMNFVKCSIKPDTIYGRVIERKNPKGGAWSCNHPQFHEPPTRLLFESSVFESPLPFGALTADANVPFLDQDIDPWINVMFSSSGLGFFTLQNSRHFFIEHKVAPS